MRVKQTRSGIVRITSTKKKDSSPSSVSPFMKPPGILKKQKKKELKASKALKSKLGKKGKIGNIAPKKNDAAANNDVNNNNSADRHGQLESGSPTSSQQANNDGSVAATNDFTFVSSVNPYKPDGLREIVDVGVQQTIAKAVYSTLQFSNDYIIGTEKVFIDIGGNNQSSFDGWSIRKVKYGQDPNGEVLDKKGVAKKPFNFTGKLSTLPELHRALRQAERDCVAPKEVTLELADEIQPNKFGVVNISGISEPEYSNKIYSFSNFSLFFNDVSYVDNNKVVVTYKSITITKPKSEKAKVKSTNKKDYFEVNIPVSKMGALKMAVELLMRKNKMKVLPVDEGYVSSESEDGDDEITIVPEKTKKRRIKKKAKTPSVVPPSDSESEDEMTTVDAEVEEELRSIRRAAETAEENCDSGNDEVAEEEEEEEDETEEEDEGEEGEEGEEVDDGDEDYQEEDYDTSDEDEDGDEQVEEEEDEEEGEEEELNPPPKKKVDKKRKAEAESGAPTKKKKKADQGAGPRKILEPRKAAKRAAVVTRSSVAATKKKKKSN